MCKPRLLGKADRMKYELEFKPVAVKDLKGITPAQQRRIIKKAEDMTEGLKGDVKRLTDFTPEYRLRVGDYRVLFEVEGAKIVVYRVRHRREAYR